MICQLHLLALDELAKVKTFKGTRCFKSEYRILVQAIKILDNKSSRVILYLSKGVQGSLDLAFTSYQYPEPDEEADSHCYKVK